MKLADFDYELPKELIAQYPSRQREKCRLMVLDRAAGNISHRVFEDIAGYFKPGDCLVLNDTKVIPARLFGRRKTGGRVELFLLERKNPVSEALVKGSARFKACEKIILDSGDEVEILERGRIGRFIRFSRSVNDILRRAGHMPLPPYIDRPDDHPDRSYYQTVYAKREGATASPTAGLHFTRELIEKIAAGGVGIAYMTLHTSYGTFAPVKSENVEEHRMHSEYFDIPEEAAQIVHEAKTAGNRVFAVGSSTTRALEQNAGIILAEAPQAGRGSRSGYTDFYIYPGYSFRVIDAVITNFHLPKSTLMLFAAAFAGTEFIREAYRKAVEERYRFFSYGDAMLII
jgi:S-adenosylmethionine:tRNA ribosyltransferase-isomerase